MSLSRYLQDEELLSGQGGIDRESLREGVMRRGGEWYAQNPAETDALRGNLGAFGFTAEPSLTQAVREHVLLHYYEKFLPVVLAPHAYADYLHEHVDAAEGVEQIRAAVGEQQGCLLATAHFGAVELITPTLAAHGLDMTAALRFTTERFSAMASRQAERLRESGRFGQVRFIEVGKPKTSAALEMAAVIRRHGTLLSVFDERTEYSVEVTLRGRKVWGGAGLDRLIRFANAPLALFSVFMIRTGPEQYRLVAQRIAAPAGGEIQAMFDSLASLLDQHVEQWYFLHETIPFIDSGGGEG
jgi:lauroyl/myristoyl acyltransferase